MSITTFKNEAERTAAGYPTAESRVSVISATREVHIDGVNVLALAPVCGDAVYHDGTTYHFFKGGSAINHNSIVALGYTRVGTVAGIVGDYALVLKDTATSQKYLDVCQYSITAISSTSITINLRFKNSAGSDTPVNVTLTSADINATSAAEISAAVEAAATADGDNADWWAYLADADGNQVASDGTQIIVQRDSCDYWQFIYVSGSGCTIALSVWGDMPASDTLRRNNGVTRL